MRPLQQQYDDAMFAFSQGDYAAAISGLEAILREYPDDFDAQLAIGMAFCRTGDFARAIEEGHKAERLRPQEQLVHTNLSLFYMRAGDKKTAEHHGLQARIASWRGNMEPTAGTPPDEAAAELKIATPAPAPLKLPDMPWKKQKPIGSSQP